MATKPKSTELIWAPQPGPQQALVDCTLAEVVMGGARGGGKTDGVIGKWLIKERRYGRHFNAVMFRRTTASAEDKIERSRELYTPMGARGRVPQEGPRRPLRGEARHYRIISSSASPSTSSTSIVASAT
jgi:hypothetical protein